MRTRCPVSLDTLTFAPLPPASCSSASPASRVRISCPLLCGLIAVLGHLLKRGCSGLLRVRDAPKHTEKVYFERAEYSNRDGDGWRTRAQVHGKKGGVGALQCPLAQQL